MSPALRARKWFVLIGLLCAFPTLIFGQAVLTKSGGEYEISGPLNGDQTAPGSIYLRHVVALQQAKAAARTRSSCSPSGGYPSFRGMERSRRRWPGHHHGTLQPREGVVTARR